MVLEGNVKGKWEKNRRKIKDGACEPARNPASWTPQNKNQSLPSAMNPTGSPSPMGGPRAVASFVEVGVQPQIPRPLQGPGKNKGWE